MIHTITSLKCIFVGYSRVQKGYRCYYPTLQHYFVSIDATFFETTPFSLSSPVTSQGEGDDLLVYIISSQAPPNPTPSPVPVKPLITQVYSRSHNPPVSNSTPTASSSDPVQNDNLPLSVKVNICVLTQSLRLFPKTICHLHLVFLLHLLILSLPNNVCEALSYPG